MFDVDAELPELHHLATYYAGLGGALWAAVDGGGEAAQVVGMVAAMPLDADGSWELRRLYVSRAHRGTGLARRLLNAVEHHAHTHGARRLLLWSDTRFEAAHRFYEKHGFVRTGAIRILDDLSRSLEFPYAKPLGPCVAEALDAAGATSAERCLGAVMLACDADASVSTDHGGHRLSSRIAAEQCLLLVGWCSGVLAGFVRLDLGAGTEAQHRAAVTCLLVHPSYRRRGLGRCLTQAAESAACRAGRTLLTASPRQASPAEGLFTALGWQQAGTIPGHVRDAQGQPHATAILFKPLKHPGMMPCRSTM